MVAGQTETLDEFRYRKVLAPRKGDFWVRAKGLKAVQAESVPNLENEFSELSCLVTNGRDSTALRSIVVH